jgi:hypothetical protein
MLYHQSKSLLVPYPETMHDFFDYVIRHHQEKGSAFGSAFGPSPNLNRTLSNLNRWFSSRFRKIPELNRWSGLVVSQPGSWARSQPRRAVRSQAEPEPISGPEQPMAQASILASHSHSSRLRCEFFRAVSRILGLLLQATSRRRNDSERTCDAFCLVFRLHGFTHARYKKPSLFFPPCSTPSLL